MNLKIKFRESFRPFAPSVLRERVARVLRDAAAARTAPTCCWWRRVRRGQARRAGRRADGGCAGSTSSRRSAREVPAITHVDYSARVQTVDRERHGRYHKLIKAFEATDRLPGDDQHQLQRARRADRLHARSTPTAASWPPTWTCWCWRTFVLLKDEQPRGQAARVARPTWPSSSWTEQSGNGDRHPWQ